MPMYEYHCGRCKKNFEELVYGDDEVVCPKCGSKKVRKLISRCSHKTGGRSGDYEAPSAGSGGSGCSAAA